MLDDNASGRLNYEGVEGVQDFFHPGGPVYPGTILQNAVPILHVGALLDYVWDDFELVGNAVLRSGFVKSGGVDDWAPRGLTVARMESTANWIQVSHLHNRRETAAPAEFLDGIAHILGQICVARVSSLFPDRSFTYSVAPYSADDGDPEANIFQTGAAGDEIFEP